jgi:hypothetical protein
VGISISYLACSTKVVVICGTKKIATVSRTSATIENMYMDRSTDY